MNDDNIAILPFWKRNATPAEHFAELQMLARKHPERFGKVAVVYEETLPNGCTKIRQISNGCNTNELIGILELGKLQVIEDTRG